ncbi:hypothetical protein HQ34_01140 [Porphyromonas cangingivalis]|nr:hypothetical protein HQ34_01140 [Porphyromonas cangingivalis]
MAFYLSPEHNQLHEDPLRCRYIKANTKIILPNTAPVNYSRLQSNLVDYRQFSTPSINNTENETEKVDVIRDALKKIKASHFLCKKDLTKMQIQVSSTLYTQ